MKKVMAVFAVVLVLLTGAALAEIPSTIGILLDGNPTAGYDWTCRPDDESVVRLVDEYYVASAGDDGAGGTYTFVFEAVSQGSTNVAFLYARPGESSAEDQTLIYVATVDDSGNLTFELSEDAY